MRKSPEGSHCAIATTPLRKASSSSIGGYPPRRLGLEAREVFPRSPGGFIRRAVDDAGFAKNWPWCDRALFPGLAKRRTSSTELTMPRRRRSRTRQASKTHGSAASAASSLRRPLMSPTGRAVKTCGGGLPGPTATRGVWRGCGTPERIQ